MVQKNELGVKEIDLIKPRSEVIDEATPCPNTRQVGSFRCLFHCRLELWFAMAHGRVLLQAN